jgi:hypothetical protein
MQTRFRHENSLRFNRLVNHNYLNGNDNDVLRFMLLATTNASVMNS